MEEHNLGIENKPYRNQITFRAILIGVLTVIFISISSTNMEFRLRSAHLALSNLPIAGVLPFAFLLFLNAFLRVIAPKYALSGTELLVVFCMAWIGGSIPGIGWIGAWAGNVAAPSYYASPENQWREILFEYLPWWLFPKPEGKAIEWFYNGLPQGQHIPWNAWIIPFFWCMTGAVALLLMGISLTVIFREQWARNERLTFPLAQIPLDLTGDFDRGSGLPNFMRNKFFWMGFCLVASVLVWNMIGYFFLEMPHIGVFDPYWNSYRLRYIRLSRYMPRLSIRILPSVIGFTFLCNTDILFSLWFFQLLSLGQLYIMNRTAFSVGLSGQPASPYQIISLERHGAMVFLVIWSIWIARQHLKEVVKIAWKGKADYSAGLLSYRSALVILLAATFYMIGWLRHAGFTLPLACFWLAVSWTAYFTIMKFLAASGFGYMYPEMGNGMMEVFVGTSNMSGSSIAALYVVSNETLFGAWRYPILPGLPNYLQMFDRIKKRRRLILAIILLAFSVGVISSFIYTISICYKEGGLSFRTWVLAGGSTRYYRWMANAINTTDPTVPDPQKICVWLFGAGLAAILSVLRARFPWWPLHPVGLVFQYTIGVNIYVTSIFITWLAKVLILRLGGMSFYRRIKPFFYGLIIGYVFMIGISFIVDMIWFPDHGHYVHGW